MWTRTPIKIVEQFAARMRAHDAQEALRIYRGVSIAMAPKREARRALRRLEREAYGAERREARRYKPTTEDDRRAAMAAFGGRIDA